MLSAKFLFNTCLLEQFFDHSRRLCAVPEPLLCCLDININCAGISIGIVVSIVLSSLLNAPVDPVLFFAHLFSEGESSPS